MTDSESAVEGDCPHLSFDEDGLASCDLHESGCKPDVCELYPDDWTFGFKCERQENEIADTTT